MMPNIASNNVPLKLNLVTEIGSGRITLGLDVFTRVLVTTSSAQKSEEDNINNAVILTIINIQTKNRLLDPR